MHREFCLNKLSYRQRMHLLVGKPRWNTTREQRSPLTMTERFHVVQITIFVTIFAGSWCDRVYEDARLNFTELAVKYGHRVEEHDVVTEDYYILKLFHVIGDASRPVLLVHGVVDTADTFIIRGNGSLAISLADRGYDVWAINTRGTRYSRSHRQLNPDIDKRFWDFSFHEMGFYDLPAAIDHILERTRQQRLSAIGHSQGNMIFYVMGSTRPEYNEKIKVMIALAPICFLEHVNPAAAALLASVPIINKVLRLLGMEELFNDRSVLRRVVQEFCSNSSLGYVVCVNSVIFTVSGSDPEEFEPAFLPILLGHYPASISRKNGVHLGQVAARKRFAQFDHGRIGNVVAYNTSVPPDYDLGKVSMRVALFVGRNDGLSSVRDSENLRDRLPNVVDYRILKRKQHNHLDHVWGRNMDKYLFPHIYSILSVYNY